MNINLQSFRNGDHREFKVVFDELMPALRWHLLSKYKGLDYDQVEDCVAESFYWLYHNRHKLRTDEHVKRVLYLVCKHRAVDVFRRGKSLCPLVTNVTGVDQDENFDPDWMSRLIALQVASDTTYPMEEQPIEKGRRLLPTAIEKLPKTRRSVIKFLLLGYDKFKISELLGISPQTVLNHKTKAIADLAKMLA